MVRSWVAVLAGCSPALIDADVRLALDAGGRRAAPVACGGATCTPENLAGRIFSGGAMWGELGPDAFSVTVLGDSDAVIEDPSTGRGGTLTFSLIEATVLAGRHADPGGGSEERPITRMEFNYDWLDATFTAPSGRYVVRTVFVDEATAPDVPEAMLRGDKLIRAADDAAAPWQWCDAAGCTTSRAALADPIREAKLVAYEHPGQGNPAYAPFVVPLAEPLSVTGDALSTPGTTWACTFDMTDAIVWRAPVDAQTALPALLDAFGLSYEPDQNGGEPTAIRVDLRFE